MYRAMLTWKPLTPLMRITLEDARDTFERAWYLQDVTDPSVKGLHKIAKKVEMTWKPTHETAEWAFRINERISVVRQFLEILLYDDYKGNSERNFRNHHSDRRSNLMTVLVKMGLQLQLGRAIYPDDTGRYCKDQVEMVAQEMLLDSKKIIDALTDFSVRNGRPSNKNHRLIRECNWTDLADKLMKDFQDLHKIIPDWKDEKYSEISGAIHRIGKLYFESLSPQAFTLTDRARELSKRCNVYSPSMRYHSVDEHEEESQSVTYSVPDLMDVPPPYSP
ncbi:MAG: hypothetical protein M1827_002214 [Pycnora praestabilis]|nr:MAG: hypothetical protein M1827_002214 [Pycnora praestabilis]